MPNWFSLRFPMATNLFSKMRVQPASSVAKDPAARCAGLLLLTAVLCFDRDAMRLCTTSSEG